MATNLLDLASYVDKQGELGRQRKNEMLLGNYASQAISGTPDQQEWAAAQAAQISPEAGFKIQEQANADQDRRQKQLYNMARFITSAYKSPTAENPNPDPAANEYVAKVWQTQFAPGLKRMGLEVSDTFDPASVLPVAQQILAMGAGEGEDLKSLRVGANGNYWAIRGGQFVDTGVPAAADTYVRDKEGVPFDILNTRTGGSIYAAPTPPPQGAPPPATLDIASSGPIASVDGTVDTGGPTSIRLTGATPEQNAAIGRAVDALRASGTPDDQIEAYVAAQEARFSQAAPAAAQQPSIPAAPGRPPMQARQAPQGYNWTPGGDLAPIAGGPNDPSVDTNQQSSIRKELESVTRSQRTVIDAAGRVQELANSTSAASDMALIFAFMKMLDPTSTVREGEYASAENTAGVPERVLNLYNKAISGNFLSPQQKQGFAAEAVRLGRNAQRDFDSNVKRYQRIARESGIDPFRATGYEDFSGVQSTINGVQRGGSDQPASGGIGDLLSKYGVQ